MPIDFCFSTEGIEDLMQEFYDVCDQMRGLNEKDVYIDEIEENKTYHVYDEINPKNFDITVTTKREAIRKAIEYGRNKK